MPHRIVTKARTGIEGFDEITELAGATRTKMAAELKRLQVQLSRAEAAVRDATRTGSTKIGAGTNIAAGAL